MTDIYEHIDISPAVALRMQEIARQLRNAATPSEAILWAALRRKQLGGRKFRRQVGIGAFVVDFYCWSEKLVIEVDGGIHELQKGADAERHALIESLGLCVVRFSVTQIESDLPTVLKQIQATFRQAAT